MKRIYPIIFLILLFAASACETDNQKYYAENFVPADIQAPTSGTQLTLTETTAQDSLRVRWIPAQFGFPAAILYSVQIAKAGRYFESAVKIGETRSSSLVIDYASLNNNILIAGVVPETPTLMEMRVNASINNHIETLYSTSIELTVTAYNIEVTYPILFVPGSYQGWNPGDSTTVVTSPKANDVYEGYFYFPAGTEFKFTAQANWDPLNWGEAGGGKLQAGAGNISVAKTGFYQVIADISKLTYSITPVTWSLRGSAIPEDTQPLSYNETDKVLETTTDLNAGEFVFQETGGNNRVLGLYFGSQLTDDGNQIIVPQNGRYKVILDLKKYPYMFRLEK